MGFLNNGAVQGFLEGDILRTFEEAGWQGPNSSATEIIPGATSSLVAVVCLGIVSKQRNRM